MKLGNLNTGQTVKVDGEKLKVDSVQRDGDRVSVSLRGKGEQRQYSGGADEEIGK